MIPGNYLTEKQKIEQEIKKLKDEVNQLQQRHRGPAIESIVNAMREYDISIDEIAAAAGVGRQAGRAAPARKSLPAKYRDPVSGATWSGRGRTPRWIADAEAQGRSRDDFLI